ncbi:MAG: serine--tRNA ligase [Patescibacteria group bacterium]
MLDIKFIKENKDIVENACKNKNKSVNLDELVSAYETRTVLKREIDEINTKRNIAQKERNIEEGQKLKGLLEEAETKYKEADKLFIALMLQVPNIPSADTPIGKDDSENKIIRQWGTKPIFAFTPKEHFEIGADLGVIDTETSTEVTGSRFSYLKGDLVLLHFALVNYIFGILTNKDILEKIIKDAGLNINPRPFIPVLPPLMIKPAVMNRMARLEPKDERYFIQDDDLMLIGSAEHTLGAMHMDEVFEEKDLPIRYAGYSSAFRREAGTYGKDMKGIVRMHQFEKLEMETFCLPETSMQEQDFLVAIQEYITQTLGLPYELMICCTGDMGDPDYRHLDINTWMPGQNKYRETHSADNMAGYQSRRLGTRVKRVDGKIEPVHMNDATAAAGRTLVAIMENYQEADGRIKIPEVLRPFVGGKTHIEKLPTLM